MAVAAAGSLAAARRRRVLVETFPRADKHYMVCYPFEGRLAHQTLGMLLTRRLERAARPLGFVANEYALAVWGLGDIAQLIASGKLDLAALFDEDMLGDDLEAWLAESALMKRTFRNCAVIAGLIERRFTGEEKARRQVTISTDLIYDVLRKHQADHILLRAARADAATGLLDIKRLGEMLSRIKGRSPIGHSTQVSPLAVPVIWESGRGTFWGGGGEGVVGEAEGEGDQEGEGMGRDSRREGGHSSGDDQHVRASGQWVTIADVTCLADLPRAVLPEQRLLVVSDLHLEKGSSFAMRGVLLPPYDTAGDAASACGRHRAAQPRMVIALGDSFHDRRAHGPDAGGPRCSIGDGARRDWIWISRQSRSERCRPISAESSPTKSRSGRLRSGMSRPVRRCEIAGHLHPKARVAGVGRWSRRCFASDGERAVMPAFGAYAGGLSIRDAAYAKIFRNAGLMAHMLGDTELTPSASRCH